MHRYTTQVELKRRRLVSGHAVRMLPRHAARWMGALPLCPAGAITFTVPEAMSAASASCSHPTRNLWAGPYKHFPAWYHLIYPTQHLDDTAVELKRLLNVYVGPTSGG